MQDNKEQLLALKYLQQTNKNIFLTGKAGTGKTTFLKSLKERLSKRFIIVAPTGVAALQAGGVTLHSFFQLPLHIYIPNTPPQTRKFRKQKINLIRSLDLIVIDEISMVRCDVLDEIDYLLRHIRYNSVDKPFGGVQLLMIGDLNQLPPIATDSEAEQLSAYYNNFYFFNSSALQKSQFITITLQHIYRQSDKNFINILNAVRDNCITAEIIDMLNERYKPDVLKHIPDGYIILCTHNNQADEINHAKLEDLQTKTREFKAEITGDFPLSMFPNAESLVLKAGAQVMFLKNDYSAGENQRKRYYNGKIGTVKHLSDTAVTVACNGEDDIVVSKYTWENVRYTINKQNKSVQEESIGTFTQFPLRLAWAVTIHKSQGLTFDKVVINSNKAFSHGQVYVALSRCRTLEGIFLTDRFDSSSVILDSHVRNFTLQKMQDVPNENTLKKASTEFEIECIISVFDFSQLSMQIDALHKFSNAVLNKSFPKRSEHIDMLISAYRNDIQSVSLKFINFIRKHTDDADIQDEQVQIIKNRALKAKAYFSEHLEPLNEVLLNLVDLELDSEDDNSGLQELLGHLAIEKELKVRFLNLFDENFTTDNYLKKKDEFLAEGNALELKSIGDWQEQKYYSHTSDDVEDITDRKLFEILRRWRNEKAKESGVKPFMILHQKVLIAIANEKPSNERQLLRIKGIGKRKVSSLGKEILEIIDNYSSEII